MVDSALYTNTSGAKEALRKTQVMSNNLANLNTVGFHADFETIISHSIKNQTMETRISPKGGETFTDHHTGPISYTGRPLDVAINGAGFIAVQNKDGQEAYTRAGNFELTEDGFLISQTGNLVLGNDGAINVPRNAADISIDQKGVVSATLKGEAETSVAEIGRLKLVQPPLNSIHKGVDGLFYPIEEGGNIPVSQDVVLVSESLEGSNVDAVRALVEMVDMSRQFDSQTKVMALIEENATKANSILSMQA